MACGEGALGAVPIQGQPQDTFFRPFLASLIRRDTPLAYLAGLRAARTSRQLAATLAPTRAPSLAAATGPR